MIPSSEERTLRGNTLWPGWVSFGERLIALKAYRPLIVLGMPEGSLPFLILPLIPPPQDLEMLVFGNEFSKFSEIHNDIGAFICILIAY